MATFEGYQVFRDRMTPVYTTKEMYDHFMTKKLLGVKIIKLKGTLMEDATHVIDFKEHGVTEAKASYFDFDRTQRITLYLK